MLTMLLYLPSFRYQLEPDHNGMINYTEYVNMVRFLGVSLKVLDGELSFTIHSVNGVEYHKELKQLSSCCARSRFTLTIM